MKLAELEQAIIKADAHTANIWTIAERINRTPAGLDLGGAA